MKKTIKALTIAASVAAVVGIGAVSFAKWSGSTTQQDAAANVSVGNITVTAGFIQSSDYTLSFGTDKLVPVDQGTPGAGQTTMLTAALGDIQVVKGTYSFTLSATTNASGLKFYYQVAETGSVNAPSGLTEESGQDAAAKESSIASQLSGWVELGTATSNVSVSENVKTVSNLSLYIVLVSSDTDDMNTSAALKLTLNSTPS